MAIVLIDGFDAGDTTLKWYNGAAASSTTSTRFSSGSALSVTNTLVSRPFTASSQVFIGLAMNTSNIDGAIRPYFVLYGDGGATAHLSIGFANNTLNVYRGSLGTLLASYSATFTANTWYNIEVSATVADAGGTCVVKLNGTQVINFSGDTKNGGTNTTVDTIGLASNGGYSARYDDLYICDSTGSAPQNTFLGDVRVRTISPSGAGTSTQFTPSTGANYAAVDELPYSATDYVSSTTSGNRDTYAMADVSIGGAPVYAVQNNIIAKKTDAAAASIKPAVRSGGTVYYGTTTSLTASDKVVTHIHPTNPNTGTAWTESSVNALEAGFEVA